MVSGSPTVATGRAGANRLFRQVSQVSLLILLAVLALVIGGLFWATQRSDDVSVQRQVRVAQHAIEVALDDIALQQETVAVWDDSARHIVAPVKDRQWLFDNLGLWLFRIFHHDRTILLDEHDRLIQSVSGGRIERAQNFERIRPDLTRIIAAARGHIVVANGIHDRHPGQPLPSNSSVRTTSRAVHDTVLALVGGRPAAVSAMLIQPSTPMYVGPRSEWPVLVSIRYLDGAFMRELESTHLLGRPRFSLTSTTRPSEHALALHSERRQRLGYLIWTPELPGSRIIGVLLPVNLGAIVLLSIVLAALMYYLRQLLRQRGALEEHANQLAYHDSLTGLANRNLFHQRLDQALAGPHPTRSALLLIDLDRFKQVNDTLGHLAGDQLIQQFGERLVDVVGGEDMVARLGGDEFAVLLAGDVSEASVQAVCQAILGVFAQPFTLLGSSVHASASIGAAGAPEARVSGTELLRRADVALYRSKADGRRCARLFRAKMDEEALHRAQVEAELRVAVAERQFSIWSQPQVTARGAVAGYELLLRWEHPAHGTVSPDRIIPVAEETGLIVPIGDWVLEQALDLAARQPEIGFVALNLSPVQLRSEEFAKNAIASCRSAGVDPARIELEITEQSLLDDSGTIRASLVQLRQAGFRISLDDFGTGYSSLNYLRRFKVDKLKIDRSFVAGIDNSSEARAIIAAIVGLGQAFGLTVTAEGVEDVRQRELLVLAGCDLLQGHYFARPTPLSLFDDAPRTLASLTN